MSEIFCPNLIRWIHDLHPILQGTNISVRVIYSYFAFLQIKLKG